MPHLPPDGPPAAAETAPSRTTPDREITVMRGCVRLLDTLDAEARPRAVSWIADRYGAELAALLRRFVDALDAEDER